MQVIRTGFKYTIVDATSHPTLGFRNSSQNVTHARVKKTEQGWKISGLYKSLVEAQTHAAKDQASGANLGSVLIVVVTDPVKRLVDAAYVGLAKPWEAVIEAIKTVRPGQKLVHSDLNKNDAQFILDVTLGLAKLGIDPSQIEINQKSLNALRKK